MNKQRFLAELRRLLVFMTESDRSIALEKYTLMFDEAGEEGEAALLETLGSPTKAAITLSRGYVAGQLTAETKQREALKKAEKSARAAKAVSADDYDPGAVEEDPIDIILRSLDEPDEPEPEEEPEDDGDDGDEYDGYDDEDEEDADGDAYQYDRRPVYRRAEPPMPRAAGVSLLVLVLLVAGVPLAGLTLGVALLWLVPGVGGTGAAILAAIGALWCISYIADALIMLGLGFLLLAAALLLLFCGIWLDTRLIGLYVRGVRALADALLGRREIVRK